MPSGITFSPSDAQRESIALRHHASASGHDSRTTASLKVDGDASWRMSARADGRGQFCTISRSVYGKTLVREKRAKSPAEPRRWAEPMAQRLL
jgi:hypothetical protein